MNETMETADRGAFPIAPKDADLEAFWVHAINAARLNPAEAVMGQDEQLSLIPVAFSFGITRQEADDLCALVLSGAKRATSSYAPLYEQEGEALPEKGDLQILCDGAGVPRALLVNEAVQLAPFDQVGEKVAAAEGEGDRSLAYWRKVHQKIFQAECDSAGITFSRQGGVVTEYFKVLYAA